MKTLKLVIGFFCYFGTGFVFANQITDGVLQSLINVNPATQRIIIYLLIFFWVVKIAWFIYDKFFLEREERNLNMSKLKEEIEKITKENDKDESNKTSIN